MNRSPITTHEILTRLRVFKKRREAEYSLQSLGVFGSFARGEAKADSDVDIVFETGTPNLFLTSRMKRELEEILARRVDMVRLRRGMSPRLKQRILKDVRYV